MVRLPVMPSDTLHRLRLIPPSASIRFPSKRTNRKNHLRPKILKTLTKPLPTAPFLEIVPVEVTVPNPIPFFPENETIPLDTPSREIHFENFPADEADKLEEFQASETTNRGGVVINISAKSVLKFCVCLVGVFVIQSLCAFWFVENTNSSKKEKRLIDLNGKGSVLLNGSNVAYFDGAEMEDKINEIRAMAREARKREKTEREDDNEDNDIEREIGARLAKLEKRLSSNREKLPGSLMKYLGLFGSEEEDGVKEKNLELKEDKENLMFRKNLRFGSPSMDSRTNPKGFSGSSDPRRSSNSTNGSDPNGQSVAETSETNTGREAMNKQLNSSQTDGDNLKQEKVDLQKGSDSVTESSRSKKLETEVNQKARRKPNGFASSSRERSRDFGKRPKAKIRDKQSAVQAVSWWLNLPYVLAILMRRGPEHEAAGLYALRTDNGVDGGDESSYTVAFEDRGDANNFCYLLESYFEDLGDFRADIVPLSTKDIQEEVKSGAKSIIVVKKGQLKLYAGQPFGEVEMALQSLLEQD
ncbi:uncharacterized protein [Euphorbia lathyris]|uniref:uncharacterized protein n=1 Tax=Euphorbia lathyris TaxID=212925 RepID=UPI00331383B5